MADELTIPDDLRKQHPELIELILGSESMNNEERQYWINILPIMTPEQVQNLRDILQNEKRQLQEIDQKYSSKLPEGTSYDASRDEKRTERVQKEKEYEEKEEEQTQALLERIENL